MLHNHEDPTLQDLIAVIRRGFLPSVLCAVLAGGATYLYFSQIPPTFEAYATIVATTQDPNQRDFGTTLVTAPPLSTAVYVAAIRSRPVVADAYRTLIGEPPGIDHVEALIGALSVRAEDGGILRLFARDGDPLRAQEWANAVADAALRWDVQRATQALETIIESLVGQIASIDNEIAAAVPDSPTDGLQRTRADLQLHLSSARALRTAAVGRLEILEPAAAPRGPIAPRPVRNGSVAAVVAIFFIYGILLLRDAFGTRVRSSAELGRLIGAPVLAQFPRVRSGRRGIGTEAASHLRTAIRFATGDATPKVIMVTSAVAKQGKSTVALALAESFARLQSRVLLIDADLRHPIIAHEYGLNPQRVPSLRDMLKNVDQPAAPARVLFGRRVELDVIPSFKSESESSELLSTHLPELLQRLRPDYDVIVIDSMPILPFAPSLTVAPQCNGVVIAVDVATAQRHDLIAMSELLQRAGTSLLGAVVTNVGPTRQGVVYTAQDGARATANRADLTKGSAAVPARSGRSTLLQRGED